MASSPASWSAPRRAKTFLEFSDWLVLNRWSAASNSCSFSFVLPSRLISLIALAHSCKQRSIKPSSPSLALRTSTPLTPASSFSLYSMSAFSASSISFSNLSLSSLSARAARVMPSQLLKVVWMRDLSLVSARPRSAFLDLAFCSAPNLANCVSTATSCCCACSATSADRCKRSSRFSILFIHVSWHLWMAATSLLACTTARFSTCWPMLVESTSSMVSWMPCASPSSMDFMTREIVVTSICNCKATWSKSSRMPCGSLSTSSRTICCSSMTANLETSSEVRDTPLMARISSAAVTAFVCVHFLPSMFKVR
mmetsp:Transcript_53512/g.124561  ORF Transcript_53512/g.124561 Transcript_53512/m.124561 type:complete len:311 (-) Transcript_53512:131-1063(-)